MIPESGPMAMAAKEETALALHGGDPVRDPSKPWPGWPVFDDRERDALAAVLESGDWWYGERVAKFEGEFAAFQGGAHCVSCTSGTVAAEVALQALGVGAGDEVIVPPFTFIATATSVLRVGARPVFVDIDETWNLDPDCIEKAISPHTKAIMPVHFGGLIADMDRICAIAKENDLWVCEDACHAWGCEWKGKGAGVLGHCGVFSFQASKNMTAGEGGAILTDDPELAERCRSITNSGRMAGEKPYLYFRPSTNARITEFAAALLSVQLTRVEEQNKKRNENATWLNEKLGEIEGLTPQPGDARMTRRGYHIYCLRIDPDLFGCSRERFLEAVNAEGLPMGAGYPLPLYKQPLFIEGKAGDFYRKVSCPVCEDLCRRSATWFRHSILLADREDMKDIVEIMAKVHAQTSTMV